MHGATLTAARVPRRASINRPFATQENLRERENYVRAIDRAFEPFPFCEVFGLGAKSRTLHYFIVYSISCYFDIYVHVERSDTAPYVAARVFWCPSTRASLVLRTGGASKPADFYFFFTERFNIFIMHHDRRHKIIPSTWVFPSLAYLLSF